MKQALTALAGTGGVFAITYACYRYWKKNNQPPQQPQPAVAPGPAPGFAAFQVALVIQGFAGAQPGVGAIFANMGAPQQAPLLPPPPRNAPPQLPTVVQQAVLRYG
eukprot:TRINITY_DN19279_c0_g1_i3.p4 TRINITY_DN19279_c0_g1~~TRINITY_DN19279_c0_g1_i3.p4  ORF type:complete len:106 (+),score=38.62 TRINITY_DN19279_c0_g1_i3:68-385(+)